MRKYGQNVLVILSALVHIIAEYQDLSVLVYVSKPLTTLTIFAIALTETQEVLHRYKVLILIGLGWSLIGDILLMLPYDLFLFGLSSFLVAHVFYLLAFRVQVPLRIGWVPTVLVIGYGAVASWVLFPGLGSLRIPVLAYLVVILAMLYQAWNRQVQHPLRSGTLAAIGATAFVLSDTLLAVNKFRVEFLASTALVLTTYYLAQWCISQSVSESVPAGTHPLGSSE